MILSIITGTYNRIQYLQAMLESARASLPPNFVPGVDYEFVLADGGSTDGTIQWCKGQPGITVLEQGELLGAIKAFNAAGAAAKGDYLLVANDDVTFIKASIAAGLAYMMDHPDVGAGCFLQDRGRKDFHVESMPVFHPDGTQEGVPYMQVGVIPKWLWDYCGGWGDWGGRTYGGDNWLSGKVYEAGYKVVPLDDCKIHDSTPKDQLREINNTNNKDGQILWENFRFKLNTEPQIKNPLPERKRVLYAPIIETGYAVQKAQKRGLREALGQLGLVWEVDYIYSREPILDAAWAWKPHFVLTQFHTAAAFTPGAAKDLRNMTQEWMANFSGDVWSDQATPEMMEILRIFDIQLTVNASLLPEYKKIGVNAVYWQNAFEPGVIKSTDAGPAADVIFIGNCYQVQGARQSRLELAQSLKELPFKVSIYGNGYPEGLAEGESLYDFRKTGQLYRGARIAIADNQFLDATAFFSDRAFMIMAAGGCMMMHQRVNGIEEYAGLIPGVHFVEWDTEKDRNDKIAYYLANEMERTKIALAGTMECRKRQTYGARVQTLTELMKTRPKRTNTISAMMIVKNEAGNIETNIRQLGAFADEIIIVDTGSTDGTLKKLEALKEELPILQIHKYEGFFDFSTARNYAKSLCTKEWVFWMDADDRISERTLKNLKAVWPWKRRNAGVTNPIAISILYQDSLDGNACLQTRLFRNFPRIEWRGRAMETPDQSLQELGIKVEPFAGENIIHLSETNPVRQTQKQSGYIALLKRDQPSPLRDFNISNCYAAMQDWGAAFLWIQEVVKKADGEDFKSYANFVMGYFAYRLELPDLALEYLEQSTFADAYFLRFKIEKARGEERFELVTQFVNAGMDSVYPTFYKQWLPEARSLLLEWHTKEIAELTEA